jgi:hypothetical protein
MGKSAIAAELARLEWGAVTGAGRGQHELVFGACFFCSHDDERKHDPKHLIFTLASQLSSRLPEYRSALMKEASDRGWTHDGLKRKGVKTLFGLLLVGLLQRVTPPPRPVVLLVDAVDECERAGRNDLLALIRNNFGQMPDWVRLVVTSRPSSGASTTGDIERELARFDPVVLLPSAADNLADVRAYARVLLQEFELGDAELKQHMELLAEKSSGVFLYLHYMRERLARLAPLGSDGLRGALEEMPRGIESVYRDEFARLNQELLGDSDSGDLGASQGLLQKCMEVVVAAKD